MQAKYHRVFARLLLIQIRPLIRSSIQLLQQQHQHTQQGAAESKQMSTKDSSKPSSGSEGNAHRDKEQRAALHTGKGAVTKHTPAPSKT